MTHFRLRLLLLAVSLVVVACTPAPVTSAARDPNVLGATGRTVVIGSHSSMAGSGRVHPDWNNASTSGD
jgi:hypothetical protein